MFPMRTAIAMTHPLGVAKLTETRKCTGCDCQVGVSWILPIEPETPEGNQKRKASATTPGSRLFADSDFNDGEKTCKVDTAPSLPFTIAVGTL